MWLKFNRQLLPKLLSVTPRVRVVSSKHLSQDNIGCFSTENTQESISPLLLPSRNPLNCWQRSGQLAASTTVQRAIPVAHKANEVLLVYIICAKGCTNLCSGKACIMDADNTPATQVTVIQVQTIAIKMRRLQVSNSRVGAREEAGELHQTILLYSQAVQGRKPGGIHIFSYLFPKTEWSSQLL